MAVLRPFYKFELFKTEWIYSLYPEASIHLRTPKYFKSDKMYPVSKALKQAQRSKEKGKTKGTGEYL